MKKILDILKEYWNLYSPFIISSIASWLVDWNANQMVTINQWIGVTLSLMALFTMIKFIIFPKKKKNAVEKLVSAQKVVKNTEMIINQEEKIKEKIKIGGYIMKVLKWIKNYWQQLIGLLGALIYCFFAIFLVVQQYLEPITSLLPQSLGWTISVYVVYSVLTILIGFYLFRNQIKWVGVGSIQKATDYINNKGQEIAGTLNNANKKKFKSMLNASKKALKVAQNNLSTLTTNYNSVVKQLETQNQFLETLFNVGAEQNTISEAQARKNEITSSLNTIANELNKAKQEVSNLEKNVNDYEKALAM